MIGRPVWLKTVYFGSRSLDLTYRPVSVDRPLSMMTGLRHEQYIIEMFDMVFYSSISEVAQWRRRVTGHMSRSNGTLDQSS